eukprot:SAG31_NODE_117_length_24022_cov_6.878067_2_plen_458_part_00
MEDEHWDRSDPRAPVFLYIGGEGPMENAGHNFVNDVLLKYRGLKLSLEHRYYGCWNASSCPYCALGAPPGNCAGRLPVLQNNEHLRQLTSKQALADLAAFHTYATEALGISTEARWVGIGGSYPGMLAAFLRASYPNKFFASVASSAPVHGVLDMTTFEDIKASAYAMNVDGVQGGRECAQAIRNGHETVRELLLQGEAGHNKLRDLFPLSVPTATYLSNATNRRTFAGCGVANFPAQSNDPTCSRPGCGITQICKVMVDDDIGDPLARLAHLSAQQRAATNNSGVVTGCEMDWEMPPGAMFGPIPPGHKNYWGYQTCNEFGFYETCENGTACMYARGLISFASDPLAGGHRPNDFCIAQFGIASSDTLNRIAQVDSYYEGLVANASRIIWVNGDVDPWHRQSNYQISPGLDQPILPIVKGAHHCAWMSSARDGEQASLVQVRAQIWMQLDKWLNEM